MLVLTYILFAWNSTFPIHEVKSSIIVFGGTSNKTLLQKFCEVSLWSQKNENLDTLNNVFFLAYSDTSDTEKRWLTKGCSFLHPLRSSDKRALAMPDIFNTFQCRL